MDVCRDVVKTMNEINSRNLGVELSVIDDFMVFTTSRQTSTVEAL